MNMSMLMNKPDSEYLAYVKNINAQCNQHAGEWMIDPERLATFNTLLGNAETAYEANSNPATKNATTSANKKVAFGELKHFTGPYIDYLEANLLVPDSAIMAMGLRSREHHHHQPLPAPGEQTVLSLMHSHCSITVYAARPVHDHPTSGVGPARYHGFMIRYKIEGDAKYQTEVSTRLHHTLYFDHEDIGKRVLISAAWVNPRLQPGPWSDELTEIII